MPIYTLTFLTAAALVLYVYSCDEQQRTPWGAVLIALAAGFVGMWVIGFIDAYALRTTNFPRGAVVPRAALIAFIEETGKLVTLVLLSRLLLKSQFNDPMDGLIYGRFVGLGMAMQESLLYLSISPATVETLGVEVVRLFAHSLMAAMVGFAMSVGAQRDGEQGEDPRREYPVVALGGLALSMSFHFAWNVVAYQGKRGPITRLTPMVLMLLMMVVWKVLWVVARRRSGRVWAAA